MSLIDHQTRVKTMLPNLSRLGPASAGASGGKRRRSEVHKTNPQDAAWCKLRDIIITSVIKVLSKPVIRWWSYDDKSQLETECNMNEESLNKVLLMIAADTKLWKPDSPLALGIAMPSLSNLDIEWLCRRFLRFNGIEIDSDKSQARLKTIASSIVTMLKSNQIGHSETIDLILRFNRIESGSSKSVVTTPMIHCDFAQKRRLQGPNYRTTRYFTSARTEEGFGSFFLNSFCMDDSGYEVRCGTRMYTGVPRVDTRGAMAIIEQNMSGDSSCTAYEVLDANGTPFAYGTTPPLDSLTEPELKEVGIDVAELDSMFWTNVNGYSFHRSPRPDELPGSGIRFLGILYPHGKQASFGLDEGGTIYELKHEVHLDGPSRVTVRTTVVVD